MSQYSDNKFIESDNHSWGIIYNMVDEGTTVLDIGCSSGTLGDVLIKNKRCIVDGVEPFKKDAELASKKLRKVYRKYAEDISKTNIETKYDYIVLADVIEHLVDPVSALKKIKELLNDNGKVLFSIPNMAHISIRLSLMEGKFQHTETGLIDKTHLHFYTKAEIEHVFKLAGYSISNFKYTYATYPRSLINERLNEIGLKFISQDRAALYESVESQAFQFVGAVVSDNKLRHHKPIKDLPHLKDSKLLDKMITELNGKVALLEKVEDKAATQEQEIDRLLQQEAQLGHRLVRRIYLFKDKFLGRK